MLMFSWRAEEAAFGILVAVVSSEESDEYDRFLRNVRPALHKAMLSSSISFPW